MTAELRTERRDTTLVLTISDPGGHHALTAQVSAAGVEALSVAEADPSVHAVVLVGDGAHFYAAGEHQRFAADRLQEPGAQLLQSQMLNQFIEALRTHPKPVIAAVEGAAAGAGFSLALACDLVVAAEDARFAMTQGRVGLSPDGGGSWHLAQALPRALALQLIWLGEPVTARELQTWGLVNRVTDSGQALVEALRLAHQLSACAPNVLASAKELVNQARLRPLAEHLHFESSHLADNLSHANGAEGLRAFLEKREPRFR